MDIGKEINPLDLAQSPNTKPPFIPYTDGDRYFITPSVSIPNWPKPKPTLRHRLEQWCGNASETGIWTSSAVIALSIIVIGAVLLSAFIAIATN